MTILTNFKLYTPEEEDLVELSNKFKILFIKSEEGVDWYKSQKSFNPEYLKIVFDASSGEIISVTKDITGLWPIDASVADIDYDTNATIADFKDKIFDIKTKKIKEKVLSSQEIQEEVDKQIKDKRQEAFDLITPLQYAKDLDMIDEKESAYLEELQKYVVYLSRIPSQSEYPSNIKWPEMPTK